MRLRTTRLAASCAVLLAGGCATSPDRNEGRGAPVGRLDHRIGTFLRIEGVRAEAGKVGSSTLRVDTINGLPCDPPREVRLDNLSLPVGTRCRLSGYESGRWIGVPPEVSEAEGIPQHQAMWQFQTYFIVTSIQSPESLRQSAPGLAR